MSAGAFFRVSGFGRVGIEPRAGIWRCRINSAQYWAQFSDMNSCTLYIGCSGTVQLVAFRPDGDAYENRTGTSPKEEPSYHCFELLTLRIPCTRWMFGVHNDDQCGTAIEEQQSWAIKIRLDALKGYASNSREPLLM